ncbi:MAG: DUF6311 domain-containing protein [Lachnospiraceae bacterium]|nr:DUF6311 domain-containing protein [Lachnospiraceae bacterium]
MIGQEREGINKGAGNSIFREKKLFFMGFGLGALLFVLIFGIRVLDVTNDSWIFALPDPDIEQHYIGWVHFRKAPWGLPLGLMNSLSYPYSMSVLWTDSIPIVAILFKAIEGILPETFQYLGWYGLLSMALTGGFATLLVKKVTGNRVLSLIAVFVYSLSFPIQQRMFYHTTLTAHWLILLPLLLWLDDFRDRPLGRKCLVWGLLSFLGVTIHPYLWAMGELLLIFALLEELLSGGRIGHVAITFLCTIGAALFGLWLEGAFYGSVNAGWPIGGFESNFNTFFNSLGDGKVFPAFPLQVGFQYEGFGYLGAGVLLLLAISGIFLLVKAIRTLSYGKRTGDGKPLLSLRRKLLLLAFLVFFLAAVFPKISFNEALIFELPMPDAVKRFFGIFRSNGRFIWVADYLLMTFSFWGISRIRGSEKEDKDLSSAPDKGTLTAGGEAVPLIICLCCALLQLYDMSDNLQKKHEVFTASYTEAHCDLDQPAFIAALKPYHHLVMTYSAHLDNMRFAYFAGCRGLTINRFYFARDIDERTDARLQEYYEDAFQGNIEEDCLYLLNRDSYEAAWKKCPLYFYDVGGTIVGAPKPLPGCLPYEPG